MATDTLTAVILVGSRALAQSPSRFRGHPATADRRGAGVVSAAGSPEPNDQGLNMENPTCSRRQVPSARDPASLPRQAEPANARHIEASAPARPPKAGHFRTQSSRQSVCHQRPSARRGQRHGARCSPPAWMRQPLCPQECGALDRACLPGPRLQSENAT